MTYRPSKGIYYNRQHNIWVVRITIEGCRKYIGSFHTEAEAQSAYENVASKVTPRIDNITNAPETDLAWAAGIIDGEGCISIVRMKPSANYPHLRYELRIAVKMIHKPTVERIKSIFGRGTITVRHRANQRNQFNWLVGIHNASAVLRLVLPYLVTKRAEAELGLEFEQKRTVFSGKQFPPPEEWSLRESYQIKMKALKRYKFE